MTFVDTSNTCTGCQARERVIKELEAERDKLREALQTIADECEIEFQYAADVARGALKERLDVEIGAIIDELREGEG